MSILFAHSYVSRLLEARSTYLNLAHHFFTHITAIFTLVIVCIEFVVDYKVWLSYFQ